MKNFVKDLANYLVFLVAAILFTALQSSLWLQLFGWFPSPQIWLCILTFWVLYRNLWEATLMCYILAIAGTGFTSLPPSHLLIVNLLTALSLAYLKRRVYWAGSTFYMLATGGAVVCHLLFSIVVSWKYDANPIRDISIFDWVLTILMTMLLSLPLHRIFGWFDHLTNKEHPTEAGTGIL